MSDVLVSFAEPLTGTHDAWSAEDYEAALDWAASVWNILVMWEDEVARGGGVLVDDARMNELDDMMDIAVASIDGDGVSLVEALRERRRLLYPHDRRLVLRVVVERRGPNLDVMAASSMPGEVSTAQQWAAIAQQLQARTRTIA